MDSIEFPGRLLATAETRFCLWALVTDLAEEFNGCGG